MYYTHIYIYTYKYHHSNSHKLWFRDVLATADTKAPGRTGCSSSPGTFLRRVWLISNNSVDLTKRMTVFELQKFLPRLVPNSHEVLSEIHYEFGEPMWILFKQRFKLYQNILKDQVPLWRSELPNITNSSSSEAGGGFGSPA